MVVFGEIAQCREVLASHSAFQRGFDLLEMTLDPSGTFGSELTQLPLGALRRVEIGDNFVLILQHAQLHPVSDIRWEAHHRAADIQCVIRGQEWIGIAPRKNLQTSEAYDEARDVLFLQPPSRPSRLFLEPGVCAVLLPSDAHAPQGVVESAMATSLRVVVKVPLLD